MAACNEDFYFWDDFDPVLAIFCSYRYGASASKAVEIITTDEKILLVRYSLHVHQHINKSRKGWLLN